MCRFDARLLEADTSTRPPTSVARSTTRTAPDRDRTSRPRNEGAHQRGAETLPASNSDSSGVSATELPDSARNLFPDLIASAVGISLTGAENAFLAFGPSRSPPAPHASQRAAPRTTGTPPGQSRPDVANRAGSTAPPRLARSTRTPRHVDRQASSAPPPRGHEPPGPCHGPS
jgi:hypothetical protein